MVDVVHQAAQPREDHARVHARCQRDAGLAPMDHKERHKHAQRQEVRPDHPELIVVCVENAARGRTEGQVDSVAGGCVWVGAPSEG